MPAAGALAGAGPLDDWYREHGARHGFTLDESQWMAVRHLQRLHDELLQAETMRRHWLRRMLADRSPVRGVYLWGGVGRGKSFLMDGFFACAPVASSPGASPGTLLCCAWTSFR
jgi:cell division protein ZapE